MFFFKLSDKETEKQLNNLPCLPTLAPPCIFLVPNVVLSFTKFILVFPLFLVFVHIFLARIFRRFKKK